MKILAFDQATIKTGMAFFEDSELKELTTLDFSDRKIAKTRKQLMALKILSEIKEKNPDVIVIEDVAFQKNAASLIDLARLQGVIVGWCLENEKELVIYKPATWRKMLGFKQGPTVARLLLKKQAKVFVREHYGVNAGEDEADAVCIGCAYAVASGMIDGGEFMKEDKDND